MENRIHKAMSHLAESMFHAGVAAVLGLPPQDLGKVKTWHDDGADPSTMPTSLASSMKTMFDKGMLHSIDVSREMRPVPIVDQTLHDSLRELLALLGSLSQEAELGTEWHKTSQAGIAANLELLRMLGLYTELPEEFDATDSTSARLDRASEITHSLTKGEKVQVEALHSFEPNVASSYGKRVAEIRVCIGILRNLGAP